MRKIENSVLFFTTSGFLKVKATGNGNSSPEVCRITRLCVLSVTFFTFFQSICNSHQYASTTTNIFKGILMIPYYLLRQPACHAFIFLSCVMRAVKIWLSFDRCPSPQCVDSDLKCSCLCIWLSTVLIYVMEWLNTLTCAAIRIPLHFA